MLHTILVAYFTAVLFKSCTAWIINDINTKIMDKNEGAIEDIYGKDATQREFNLIYPGTKWCGAGNVADGYDDLGTEKEADKCCRDHDNCPDIIEGGETKYNLTNKMFYTRLSCSCDDTFNSCMKTAGTKAAKIIGNIYFNALQSKCFRKDYPVIECKKKGGWMQSKCLEYSYDTKREQVYQWFDLKEF